MATERHKAGDDGGFAKANIGHHRHPPAAAAAGLVEMSVDLLEKPVSPGEDGVHGDAGHLEQQRLQGNVLGPIGCKTHWWVRRTKAYKTLLHTPAGATKCPWCV